MSAAQNAIRSETRIALSGTFTIDPVVPVVRAVLQKFGIDTSLSIAPYNQLFQSLLSPSGVFHGNESAINVCIVRLADLRQGKTAGSDDENIVLLGEAVRQSAESRAATNFVILCPDGREDPRHPVNEERLARTLDGTSGTHLLTWKSLIDRYRTPEPRWNPYGDELGAVALTPGSYLAMGIGIARACHAAIAVPSKVLVLDCDNTIWSGVVGEVGPAGVRLEPGNRILQNFAVELSGSGILVCLCSKNAESDVLSVFSANPEMPLQRHHIAAHRINWLPKSVNIRDLATELRLGLDSFVFLDDNPIEVMEVRANLPGVVALELPAESAEVQDFLDHLWIFDRLRVTREDRERTQSYAAEIRREGALREAGSFGTFIDGLNLRIDIAELAAGDLPRAAQLTQRTNQFNSTTLRRNESELSGLQKTGSRVWCIRVSDRFGDYGLVGLAILSTGSDRLIVESLLLSCRVLGRGVEHHVARKVGEAASGMSLGTVEFRFRRTERNQPVMNFLRSIGPASEELWDRLEGSCELSAESLQEVRFVPGAAAPAAPETGTGSQESITAHDSAWRMSSELAQFVACELRTVDQVRRHFAMEPEGRPAYRSRELIEQILYECWSSVLGTSAIGPEDDLLETHGMTSLHAVQVCGLLEGRQGIRLDPIFFIENRSIEAQAAGLGRERKLTGNLVVLREGPKDQTIYLFHPAGSGSAFTYYPLAKRLPARRAIGVQDHHGIVGEGAFNTLSEMVETYLRETSREHGIQSSSILAGWSLGALVALLMASRLEREKGVQPLVILLDPVPFKSRRRHTKWALTNAFRKFQLTAAMRLPVFGPALVPDALSNRQTLTNRLTRIFYYFGSELPVRRAAKLMIPEIASRKDFGSMDDSAIWQALHELLIKEDPTVFVPGRDARATAHQLSTWRTHRFLEGSYRAPERPIYSGPVACFEQVGSGGAKSWQRLCAQPIETHRYATVGTARIENPHNAFLEPENVELFIADFVALADRHARTPSNQVGNSRRGS